MILVFVLYSNSSNSKVFTAAKLGESDTVFRAEIPDEMTRPNKEREVD